jgi:transcriptional regulator with XRE-family HTH domain
MKEIKLNIKRIEQERKRLKLSQAKFSRLVGLSDSAYWKIKETESTTIPRLNKIGNALHLDPLELLMVHTHGKD